VDPRATYLATALPRADQQSRRAPRRTGRRGGLYDCERASLAWLAGFSRRTAAFAEGYRPQGVPSDLSELVGPERATACPVVHSCSVGAGAAMAFVSSRVT
jgi:hypothetical protein